MDSTSVKVTSFYTSKLPSVEEILLKAQKKRRLLHPDQVDSSPVPESPKTKPKKLARKHVKTIKTLKKAKGFSEPEEKKSIKKTPKSKEPKSNAKATKSRSIKVKPHKLVPTLPENVELSEYERAIQDKLDERKKLLQSIFNEDD